MTDSTNFEALLQEHRVIEASAEFKARATVHNASVYEEAERDPEGFWESFARELEWSAPWNRVLEWKPPFVKWFIGGKLNVSVNCLDRHVRIGPTQQGRARLGRRAWRPADADVLGSVPRGQPVRERACASLGVASRRPVAIYLPMVPELPIAMLACARIGAIHSVVVRRLQRRFAARSHQRCEGEGVDNGRRRLPARTDDPAEEDGRRGPGGHAEHSSMSVVVKRGKPWRTLSSR